jgi:hypothetical protein
MGAAAIAAPEARTLVPITDWRINTRRLVMGLFPFKVEKNWRLLSRTNYSYAIFSLPT